MKKQIKILEKQVQELNDKRVDAQQEMEKEINAIIAERISANIIFGSIDTFWSREGKRLSLRYQDSFGSICEITPSNIEFSWYSSRLNFNPQDGSINESSLKHIKFLNTLHTLLTTESSVLLEIYNIAITLHEEKVVPLNEAFYTINAVCEDKKEELEKEQEDKILEEMLIEFKSGKTFVRNNKVRYTKQIQLPINSRTQWPVFTYVKETPKNYVIEDMYGDQKSINKEKMESNLLYIAKNKEVTDYEYTEEGRKQYRKEAWRWLSNEELATIENLYTLNEIDWEEEEIIKES